MMTRKMGKTGETVSPLGFGCMRLPVINGQYGNIDEKEAITLIRYAIDKGVNYIDTAYPYHEGASETLVAKALKDGYREKVHLATKLPSWLIKTREDMDKFLNEQRANLQTDVIDFYLIHALNHTYWDNLTKLDLFGFMDQARADGRIKHIGFSYHDDGKLFKKIVDAYDWEFCQIQYNYMDEEYQAGREGLRYAARKGLGVVIMEPLRGGSLVTNIPDDIQAIWDSRDSDRSPAQWALSFLWDQKEVGVVLSGMNDYKQIAENITEGERTAPGSLNSSERETIDKVKEIYKSRIKVNCTACKYCMPCPAGVDIPTCFQHYNNGSVYRNREGSKTAYNKFVPTESKASACIGCGKCEKVCPQHLPIREYLKEVADTFEA